MHVNEYFCECVHVNTEKNTKRGIEKFDLSKYKRANIHTNTHAQSYAHASVNLLSCVQLISLGFRVLGFRV